MLWLGNPSGPKVRDAMRAGHLGMMTQPRQGNQMIPRVPWAADNGRFSDATYVGDDALRAWWATLQPYAADCLFVTAPDVVAAARATLDYSTPFLAEIRALGFPAAFVAQNGLDRVLSNMFGQDDRTTWWGSFDVLFLGGVKECRHCRYTRSPLLRDTPEQPSNSRCPWCFRALTEWKLGPAARALTREARWHGLRVHMGRVNSLRRCQIADAMGCATTDGTHLTREPDFALTEVIGWHRAVNDQVPLWEAS
jgi:hypothetical protein